MKQDTVSSAYKTLLWGNLRHRNALMDWFGRLKVLVGERSSQAGGPDATPEWRNELLAVVDRFLRVLRPWSGRAQFNDVLKRVVRHNPLDGHIVLDFVELDRALENKEDGAEQAGVAVCFLYDLLGRFLPDKTFDHVVRTRLAPGVRSSLALRLFYHPAWPWLRAQDLPRHESWVDASYVATVSRQMIPWILRDGVSERFTKPAPGGMPPARYLLSDVEGPSTDPVALVLVRAAVILAAFQVMKSGISIDSDQRPTLAEQLRSIVDAKSADFRALWDDDWAIEAVRLRQEIEKGTGDSEGPLNHLRGELHGSGTAALQVEVAGVPKLTPARRVELLTLVRNGESGGLDRRELFALYSGGFIDRSGGRWRLRGRGNAVLELGG